MRATNEPAKEINKLAITMRVSYKLRETRAINGKYYRYNIIGKTSNVLEKYKVGLGMVVGRVCCSRQLRFSRGSLGA